MGTYGQMEEINRQAGLLDLVEAAMAANVTNSEASLAQSAEEDAEVMELAGLFSRAGVSVMQRARLRVCSAGLLAVHRYITNNPASSS